MHVTQPAASMHNSTKIVLIDLNIPLRAQLAGSIYITIPEALVRANKLVDMIPEVFLTKNSLRSY